jgi:hypothetical protein
MVGWLVGVSCSKQLLRLQQLNNNNIQKIVLLQKISVFPFTIRYRCIHILTKKMGINPLDWAEARSFEQRDFFLFGHLKNGAPSDQSLFDMHCLNMTKVYGNGKFTSCHM